MVGSRADIQCGNVPSVNYTWQGPNNEISKDPLIIQSVSVSDNESTYKCIANIPSNLMNCQTEEESIVVNVIGKYKAVNCSIVVVIILKNIHKFNFVYIYNLCIPRWNHCIFSDIF